MTPPMLIPPGEVERIVTTGEIGSAIGSCLGWEHREGHACFTCGEVNQRANIAALTATAILAAATAAHEKVVKVDAELLDAIRRVDRCFDDDLFMREGTGPLMMFRTALDDIRKLLRGVTFGGGK